MPFACINPSGSRSYIMVFGSQDRSYINGDLLCIIMLNKPLAEAKKKKRFKIKAHEL